MKSFPTILTFFLLLSCQALSIQAQNFKAGGIYYDFNGWDFEVTAGAYEYYGDLTIPAEVDYYGEAVPVTGIAAKAFKGCTELTSVTLPESIVYIGENAFDGCSTLAKVNIPSSVEIIGENAFIGTAIYSSWDSTSHALYIDRALIRARSTISGDYNVRSNTTVIADGAFVGCNRLTTVVLPSSLRIIGKASFDSCSGLTSMNLPPEVKRINDYAFYHCSKLISLEIPESVTYIGSYALAGCTGMKRLKLWQSNPLKIKLGDDIVKGIDLDECLLMVCRGSLEAYSEAPQWSNFAMIEEFNPILSGDSNNDGIISIGDITMMANYILGERNPWFSFEGADINHDGYIDITDFSCLIELILTF